MLHNINAQIDIALQRDRVASVVADKEILSRFTTVIPALLRRFPGEESSKAISFLADTFSHLSTGHALSCVAEVRWGDVFKRENALSLLALSSECAKALAERDANWGRDIEALSVTHALVSMFLKDLLTSTRKVQPQSADEVSQWLKALPGSLDALKKRITEQSPSREPIQISEIANLGIAMLQLMTSNNLPASVATRLVETILEIDDLVDRAMAINRFALLASSSLVMASVDDKRVPILGRAAFYSAVKQRRHYMPPEKSNIFEKVAAPSARHYWEYIGQRLEAISQIKESSDRHTAVYAYTNLIVESLAADTFRRKEEYLFRRLHLEGMDLTPSEREFYVEKYMVDNPPGIHKSEQNQLMHAQTAERFRHIATTREEINVRKGYASTLGSGYWLLEEMAIEVGGSFLPLRTKNIERYPGSGTVLSGLDVSRAVDLSTEDSRGWYFKVCPWLRHGEAALSTTDIYFTRGWTAIARSFALRDEPVGDEWKGVIDGEPYVAMWFNDHYYNNNLPEVRHWHIPERVFFQKIQAAIEDGKDLSSLDLTPEGLIHAAVQFGLPILNVGTASVRFGSFANAWPFGVGKAHDWEHGHSLEFDKWTDPFHLHRGIIVAGMSTATDNLNVLSVARAQHAKLLEAQKFFEDIHSSFLSIEEAWAKGFAGNEMQPPASLGSPRSAESTERHQLEDFRRRDDDFDLIGSLEYSPRSRVRVLAAFLELRNKLWRQDPETPAERFPILELQYLRLFSRQKGTPFITGADMCLHMPNGGKTFLTTNDSDVARFEVRLTEGMEAWWNQEIVSRFASNNCPRIFMP